jgi:hypothetical protein
MYIITFQTSELVTVKNDFIHPGNYNIVDLFGHRETLTSTATACATLMVFGCAAISSRNETDSVSQNWTI